MKLRKVMAAVAATAVAASAMSVAAFAVDAQGTDGEALIAFAGGDWTAQYWADGNEYASVEETVIITGAGSYSVSVTAKSAGIDEDTGDEYVADGTSDIAFAALQVVNGETLFPGMVITIDSVELDGTAVALTGTPYTSSDEGITTRVNLYNEWVSQLPDDARTIDGLAADATPTPIDKACGAWTKMTVNFTVTLADDAAADDAAAEEAPADEAPAEEAPVVDNTAAEVPAAGDVDAATDSSKGSPDTGVADVAAVAGLAIVAAGAVVISRKRK
ncbi:MAG: NPXTG-anchored protein [Ruminiclostridium sp.]